MRSINMIGLFMRAEVAPGASIKDVAREAIDLSATFGNPVLIEFNGVNLEVRERDTVKDVVERFYNKFDIQKSDEDKMEKISREENLNAMKPT